MSQETEIYALIDSGLLRRYGLSLARVARFLEEAKIPIAQYRDKETTDAEAARALEELRAHYGGTLIVNDRLGLVGLADGLHLGQEDLAAIDPDPEVAVAKLRHQIGPKLLGLSTHNREEIEAANALELDYIGLGAYRPTATKADASVSGDALLDLARLSRHPVALIGGVRWEDRFDTSIRYKVLGSALMERVRGS
jgi:thiamine-phosphate pyrophosphorylase